MSDALLTQGWVGTGDALLTRGWVAPASDAVPAVVIHLEPGFGVEQADYRATFRPAVSS